MSTKLTLSLKKEIIERAKSYAKENNISLSFLIENYLQKLVSEYKFEPERKGSIVDELSGIISLEEDLDFKKSYTDYLANKYK